MDITTKTVHFNLEDETRDLLNERIGKLGFAEDKLTTLDITLTRDNFEYLAEANMHFRWGKDAHIKVTGYDLEPCIGQLVEKINHKVHKEAEKIQDHG